MFSIRFWAYGPICFANRLWAFSGLGHRGSGPQDEIGRRCRSYKAELIGSRAEMDQRGKV